MLHTPPSPAAPPAALRLATLALLAVTFLVALGSPDAGTHPDERLYLAISLDMDERGAWLEPTNDGEAAWYKPPLLYWGERVSYAALGRTLFAGRLPSALAALALALLAGALAARMHGEQARLRATLMAGTLFGVLKFGRLAMMDAPMACCLTLAALGVWRAAEEARPRGLLLAGLGVGLGCLLKGPVSVVIASLAFGAFLALRARALLFSRWTIAALGVAAAVALPWYAAATAVYGREFLDGFLFNENLSRFSAPWRPVDEARMLGGFLVFALPWLPLALFGVRWRSARADARVLLPLLWIGATLLVFTLPAHKYEHYGIACLPAVALLAAGAEPSRLGRAVTALVFVAAGGVALLVLRWPVPPATSTALAFCAASGLFAASHLWRGKVDRAVVSASLALAVLFAVAVPGASPPTLPSPARDALGERPVFTYGTAPGLLRLALGRPVHRAWSGQSLDDALGAGAAVVGIEAELSPALPRPTVELARWVRLRRSVAPAAVLDAWLGGDSAPLFEPVVAVAASP